MEKKDCSTCRYFGTIRTDGNMYPCRECGERLDKWEKGAGQHEINETKRPFVLPMPLPIYEHTFSEIPEKVRVSFTDGTSAVYELRTEQPAPVIIENIKIIRKWKQGYVNRPERRRRHK